MKVTMADIGDIFNEINNNEIPFRFENLPAIGYRWSVVGFEGDPEPGQMRLYRTEIDDGIQGTLKFLDKVPDKFRFLGFKEDSFTVKNANEKLQGLHLLQKDWLDRGEAEDIEKAVSDLSLSICKLYPESNFAQWFKLKFGKSDSLSA